jgi:hypothetical protein
MSYSTTVNYTINPSLDRVLLIAMFKESVRPTSPSSKTITSTLSAWVYERQGLSASGITDAPGIQSIQSATTKTLLKIKGFSEVKVEKVRDAVRKCLVRAYLDQSLISDTGNDI